MLSLSDCSNVTGQPKGSLQMKIWPSLIVVGICWATPAPANPPALAAVFDLSFDNTSLQGALQGAQADERHRLAAASVELRDLLAQSGCCRMADLGMLALQAQGMDLRNCQGCDVDLARKAGARISVTGWVQKVSNLILNINVVARDTTTGDVISAGSVDLRGNTDESWSRGLVYLVRNRLRPSEWKMEAAP
jgi:hypothetical protein